MQERVAVLICNQDSLLLIHRFKAGQEYYVVPGGGIEPGETVEQAARREIMEELSLEIEVGPILWQQQNQGRVEIYLKATHHSGQIKLGGPELQRQSNQNRYQPEWISFNRLEAINLQPKTAKTKIIDLIRTNQL